MTKDTQYGSPIAFRHALTDQLRLIARDGVWTLPQLRSCRSHRRRCCGVCRCRPTTSRPDVRSTRCRASKPFRHTRSRSVGCGLCEGSTHVKARPRRNGSRRAGLRARVYRPSARWLSTRIVGLKLAAMDVAQPTRRIRRGRSVQRTTVSTSATRRQILCTVSLRGEVPPTVRSSGRSVHCQNEPNEQGPMESHPSTRAQRRRECVCHCAGWPVYGRLERADHR
jgi:hypothetical protein